jgi:hypothetical protein
MDFPNHLLVRVRLLLFPNIPLSFFAISLTPSRSFSSMPFILTGAFSTPLVIRIPTPFLREKSDQFSIMYENLDFLPE